MLCGSCVQLTQVQPLKSNFNFNLVVSFHHDPYLFITRHLPLLPLCCHVGAAAVTILLPKYDHIHFVFSYIHMSWHEHLIALYLPAVQLPFNHTASLILAVLWLRSALPHYYHMYHDSWPCNSGMSHLYIKTVLWGEESFIWVLLESCWT